jgi:NADPH-dependent curcumin reductase
VICGAISQDNNTEPPTEPSNYMALLVARASMTGFLVFDYASRYPQATAELAGWHQAGRLRSVEDTRRGDIESFPATFARLFSGENIGKLVLELER